MSGSVAIKSACRRLQAREEVREPLLNGFPFVFYGFKALGIDPVVSNDLVGRKLGMKANVPGRDFQHCVEPLGRRRIVVGSVDVDHGSQRGLERLDFVAVPFPDLQNGRDRQLKRLHARLQSITVAHQLPFLWRTMGHGSTGDAA